MPKRGVPTNPWFWTVLTLLHERPMHPYEMQRLVGDRHKDLFVEHKRGSLYGVVERLVDDGSIEVDLTDRDGARPERTIYRITDRGRVRLLTWLGEELEGLDRRDLPRFVFALEKASHLHPHRVRTYLASRLRQAQAQHGDLEAAQRSMRERGVPRVSGLEIEYAATIRAAEVRWLTAVVADLDDGALAWTPPPEDEEEER